MPNISPSQEPIPPRPSRRGHHKVWVPKQYGSWAMVVVPLVMGLALSRRGGTLGWWSAGLAVCWLAGYLAYSAVSGLAKARTPQKAHWYPPVVVYACLTLAAGIAALALAGWEIVWWLLLLAVLLLISWAAARNPRQRSLVNELAVILIACTVILIARYPLPAMMPEAGDLPHTAAIAALAFGYFGGSVFYVKTMVRERGQRSWLIISLIWHLVWLVVAIVLVPLTGWWGAGFFLLVMIRTGLMPYLARKRPLKIQVIGLTEVVLSLIFLVFVCTGVM